MVVSHLVLICLGRITLATDKTAAKCVLFNGLNIRYMEQRVNPVDLNPIALPLLLLEITKTLLHLSWVPPSFS